MSDSDSSSPLAPSSVPLQDPGASLRIHHVNVFVRDQDRSVQFYVHQLGFKIVVDSWFEEQGRFILVAPPDGTALLALIAPRPESAEYKLIGLSGHVVLVAEDVVATYNDWCVRGVRFRHPPQLSSWGGRFAIFEDPDGNTFVLGAWDRATQAIEERRREAAEKLENERRAAQELEIASQVQSRLFPQNAPRLKTLGYAGGCMQARVVGGDYYDLIELGRERLGLVVGDISGKGIAAALLMANLQANFRSQCAIASDQPELFLRSVNRLFYANTHDGAFATVFFAEYDDRNGRLRYANCGHVPGLLLHADRAVERLESTCPPMGVFEQWEPGIAELRILSGDTLLIYTDGIIESFNREGEEFGEQRLIEALIRHHRLPVDDLVRSIVEEVRDFTRLEQHDDITLIAAKHRAE